MAQFFIQCEKCGEHKLYNRFNYDYISDIICLECKQKINNKTKAVLIRYWSSGFKYKAVFS